MKTGHLRTGMAVCEDGGVRPVLVRATNTRLTIGQVMYVRRLRREYGMSMPALAAQFGVSKATIADVVYRRTWKTLPD